MLILAERPEAPTNVDPSCGTCGGTGTVTDPKGDSYPCIQCNRPNLDDGDW